MLLRDLFASQDDKQGVNHSGWPHAKQDWEPKAADGKEIDITRLIQKGCVNPT